MKRFSYFAGKIENPSELIAPLKQGGVSLMTLSHGNCTYLQSATEAELQRATTLLRQAGISIRAIHGPFITESDALNHESIEHRNAAIRKHVEVIKRMPVLGVDRIHVHPSQGTPHEEDSIPKSILRDRFCSSLEALLIAAERQKIYVAMENMAWSFGSCQDLMEIVAEFKSPWLGICLDTGHSHIRGDVNQDLELIAPHLLDFHINDNQKTRDWHFAPPYGTINWERFKFALSRLGLDLPLTIEAAPWGASSLGVLVRETEALFENRILEVCAEKGQRGYVRCVNCGHIVIRAKDGWGCCCSENNFHERLEGLVEKV